MDEKTRNLLLQIAGFLTLIREGHISVMPQSAKIEAGELLNKIGESIK